MKAPLLVLTAAFALLSTAFSQAPALAPSPLPDSPGSALPPQNSSPSPQPCVPAPASTPPQAQPCRRQNPYQAFLNSTAPLPLSPRQKGLLAIHDVADPFNLLTIGLSSAFTVGIDAHNPYDPGLRGFAWSGLYSLSQDATGEFIGTFGVCSLLHEDPHYHRMANGPVRKRFLYALSRTWVAQRDDGRPMPNYEKFITYPASAEMSNLYVPGVATNAPSTAERVVIGLATDPADNLITEFLPDFARHIHVRVVVVQQILNGIAAGQY